MIPSAADNAGGMDPFLDEDVDNSVQTLKASAGSLYMLQVYNSNAVDCFLQLFDTTTPVVGTDQVLSFLIPAGDGTKYGWHVVPLPIPIAFSNSIKYAAVNDGPGGATDPAVGLVLSAGFK